MNARFTALFSLVCAIVVTPMLLLAQEIDEPVYWSPIIMGVPSLSIYPDARSTGMGNTALTTTSDGYGIYHNMSKMGYLTNTWGLSANYTPWMASQGVKGMSFSVLSGYYTFESNGNLRHALASSLRYFRVGETLAFTSNTRNPVQTHPYELAVDLGYALRFTPEWSVGLVIRYAISDYNTVTNGISSLASTVMGDLSLTYKKEFYISDVKSRVSAALALNNIGGKLTHDGGKSYLFSPTLLRIGVGLDSQLSDLHELGVHLEASKFLVPSYPINGTDDELSKYTHRLVAQSMLASFSDAKGGSLEELKEVFWGLGLEYTYAERLMARLGYYVQDPSKGTGGGFTLGAGIHYEMVTLDLSYLLATQPHSPLNNTLRIGLSIDF